ncbi:hypothetical protein ABZP36_032024 [Zizania latifolia]
MALFLWRAPVLLLSVCQSLLSNVKDVNKYVKDVQASDATMSIKLTHSTDLLNILSDIVRTLEDPLEVLVKDLG